MKIKGLIRKEVGDVRSEETWQPCREWAKHIHAETSRTGWSWIPLPRDWPRKKETLSLRKNIPDLGLLGKRIAKGEGIREDDLRSGSRRREVIEARKLFCQLAIRKMGYCGGEVARFLGVTTSAVNKAANSEEVAAFQQYC